MTEIDRRRCPHVLRVWETLEANPGKPWTERSIPLDVHCELEPGHQAVHRKGSRWWD